MNLLNLDITDNQKKIIAISLTVFIIFLFSLIFLHLPASRKITNLKKELAATQQQILGIEMLLAGAQSRDEAIRLLKQKQQYLSSKFPQKEEESIRFIPEIARKMNIEVISMQPQTRAEFLDASGKPSNMDNRVVYYLPVTLELTCFYKDLVKYIQELDSGLPAFVSIESINIKKEDQSSGKIRAILMLNLYLLN
jgi:Tfp pilus assembly protein PilO